jgi:hypothetical protein
VVQGNLIGTDATGTQALGNAGDGVAISDGSNNLIGGTASAARNIISSNHQDGVEVGGVAATGNQIQGNYIGLDLTGTDALGNTFQGVFFRTGSSANVIGGTDAGAGNVISGNGVSGIEISSSQNVVAGNYVGTDATGMVPLGNAGNGIQLDTGAANNTLGGLTAGAGNLISGNGSNGIWINGTNPNDNVVQGNYIGLNAAGNSAIGNAATGVFISDGTRNLIGGNIPGARNVISGNGQHGVVLTGSTTSGDLIQGNYIGTDKDGTASLANGLNGVEITGGASSNIIGTNGDGVGDAVEGNLISGNTRRGVFLAGAGTNDNLVAGNFIGTDATGTAALGNGLDGVFVGGGAQRNRIGSNTDGVSDDLERNVISGNAGDGVRIQALGSSLNVVAGNYVGTTKDGSSVLGNGGNGIFLNDAPNNTVGGLTTAARDVIANNTVSGIYILNTNATGNLVEGNYIGLDASGTVAMGNHNDSITIDRAPNNTVGGTTVGAGNVLADGNDSGVYIFGSTAMGNIVQGNLIGTDATGTVALGNHNNGVTIDTAFGNTIGGVAAGAANTIAFNANNGIAVVNDVSTGNAIRGNSIHDNGGLGIDLGNDGVTLNDSSGHAGPNLFQDFPLLSSAAAYGSTTVITGSLTSAPNSSYTVELFSNPAADPSGYGQGQTFLVPTNVMTDPSGLASFSVTVQVPVPIGQTITATATDAAGNTSEFSADTTVLAGTTTVVQSSASPTVFGQPVTFTATVSVAPPGSGTPTGTVSFLDGSTTLGTSPLIGGVASFATKSLSVGTHSITAVYSGDPNFVSSTSTAINQTVRQDGTKTKLSSSDKKAVFGEPLTFTASVSAAAPGSGIPSGTVSFLDGTTPVATVALDGSGTATFTTSSLTVGTHSMTAVYNGDTNFTTSASAVLGQTVSKASTTTAVVSSLNPSRFGQSVTFTATIGVVAPGGGVPAGTVTFNDGAITLATATLSGGSASFTTSSLSVGTHKITVAYSGDSNFVGSTSPVLKQVVNSASPARLAASPVQLIDEAIAVLPNDAADAAALRDRALRQIVNPVRRRAGVVRGWPPRRGWAGQCSSGRIASRALEHRPMPDLEPLRSRGEFQVLMQGLAFPTNPMAR